MHIPEHYLSPQTCAVMTAAMLPVWGHAMKKVKLDVSKEKMPLLGVGAAFSFLGMMFNVPLPGGTTGHAVGGTLIAILLGPDAACLAVTIALLIQALLFGDGGILAFGANCFNMAFVLPYAGYFVYRLIADRISSEKGRYIGAAIGSYVGINAAALCAAIEFGIQPALFHDSMGQALYCPYGLSVSSGYDGGTSDLVWIGRSDFYYCHCSVYREGGAGYDTGYRNQKVWRRTSLCLAGSVDLRSATGTLGRGNGLGRMGSR